MKISPKLSLEERLGLLEKKLAAALVSKKIEDLPNGWVTTQSPAISGGVKAILGQVFQVGGAGPTLSAGSTYLGIQAVPHTVTISNTDIARSGFRIEIKDESGNASDTNPITITGEGGQLIDGNADTTIKCPFGSTILNSDGTNLHESQAIEPQLVLDAPSNLATQPVPDVNLGSPVLINFGLNQGTGSDPVQLIGNNIAQFNQGGWYDIVVNANIETTTLATAYFAAFETGVAIPESLRTRSPLIPTTPESISFAIRQCVQPGTQLDFRMGTTSPAANGLQLFAVTPPAAFPGIWPSSSSAQIRVYRIK